MMVNSLVKSLVNSQGINFVYLLSLLNLIFVFTGKNNEKSSDANWLHTVLSSGTLSDRVAASTMLLQASSKPFPKQYLFISFHVNLISIFLSCLYFYSSFQFIICRLYKFV